MIFTERTISVQKGTSSINDTIVLYRGDKNVEVRFTLNEGSPFKFGSGASPNIIEKTEASYGQLVINTPNDLPSIFSEIVPTNEGKIVFTITAEMIDEITEVGYYTFQIRLFDENQQSRATIPEVINGIEIREPIASEDGTNEVGVATVGYALTTAGTTEDAFDGEGNYNKTTWGTGDRITAPKLNKMEAAIDGVNKKVTSNGTASNITITDTGNYFTATNVEGALEEVDSQIKDIEKNSIIANIIDFYNNEDNEDYSNAFQRAFDYLAQNYNDSDINANTSIISKLEIPSGRKYKITKTIYIKSPVLIKGIGANGTICIHGEWENSNYYDMFEIRDTTHSARICIENIRFSSIPPTKSAIYAPATFTENGESKVGFMVDGYIKNCWFESFGTDSSCGIRGTIADYLIEGNVFEHCNPCIDISVHDGQNRIVNNIFYKCFKGVLITGFDDSNSWQTKDTIISNNHMNFAPNEGVGGYFVKLDKYSLANISNNTINNAGNNELLDYGIILNKCSNIVISSNNITGIVLKGIEISNSKNIIINSNSINRNTTTNAVQAINLISTQYSNIANNNIFNFDNIKDSQGVLIHDSSNNIISNNIVKDVYYGLRTTGNSICNNFTDNLVESSYKKYEIYNTNFIKNNKNNTLTINDDYTCNGNEPNIIICDNTSFKTINFNFKGEYDGIIYTVITNNTGAIQIYDGINSISHGNLEVNKTCFVMWKGSKWVLLGAVSRLLG